MPIVRTLNPDGVPRPSGFSQAAVAGDVISIAGQIPADDSKAGGFVAQFDSALEAVQRALEACGASTTDILHLRVFVTDLQAYLEARSELAEPYAARMRGHYPPATLVEVAGLVGGAEIEIEALAARRGPAASSAGEAPAAADATTATLRLRLAPGDARYAGALVPGSKSMEVFGDLETEIALIEGGDEGLCAGYDMVEFLAPLRVGDYIEATATVVERGRSSRRLYCEIHKVRSVDEHGRDNSPPEPVLAARASVTIVVGTGS
jgi:enamine deaminase RidA (YjgF/YER057c/UK114 family)/acyl-CoA hydrolase